MTYRLPELSDAGMTDEQRRVAEAIKSGPRGKLAGPLLAWMQSVNLADRAQALGAFCRYGTSLPPHLSELAIITTGAFWKAGYEWYAHAPIALAAGVDPAAVEAIKTGQTPTTLKPDEHAVWNFTHHLLTTHVVPDDVYKTAADLLGPVATVELVGILGYYALISMTIKAFQVPVPEGEVEPF